MMLIKVATLHFGSSMTSIKKQQQQQLPSQSPSADAAVSRSAKLDRKLLIRRAAEGSGDCSASATVAATCRDVSVVT